MVCALWCISKVQSLIFSKDSRCANSGWLGLGVTEVDCHIFLRKTAVLCTWRKPMILRKMGSCPRFVTGLEAGEIFYSSSRIPRIPRPLKHFPSKPLTRGGQVIVIQSPLDLVFFARSPLFSVCLRLTMAKVLCSGWLSPPPHLGACG